ARAVEERRAGRNACLFRLPVGLLKDEPDAVRMRFLDRELGAHAAAACFARYAAIHAAPHSSWPIRKSVARTASTISCERASMIALVNPWLAAIARNPAPSVSRPGSPNEVFDAPHVMLTPSSSRISLTVSRNRVT